jgi:hypothetical protein
MASWFPAFSKAWFISATERWRRRTEPSPTSAGQSSVAVFDGSIDRVIVAVPAGAAPVSPRDLAICTAERTMLSPITIIVTVAPLTMSTGGLERASLGAVSGLRPT